MFFQLDWFCTADRMLVFGLTLSVSALICLALLFAEYKKEMRKRKNKRRWKASLFFMLKNSLSFFKIFFSVKKICKFFFAFYYLNNINNSKLEFFLTHPLDFPKTRNLVNALKTPCIMFLFSGIYLYSDTAKSNTGAFSALKNRRPAYVNTQA